MTYLNVPCPRCGANLDVPVAVFQLGWSETGSIRVEFCTQHVEHECPA